MNEKQATQLWLFYTGLQTFFYRELGEARFQKATDVRAYPTYRQGQK